MSSVTTFLSSSGPSSFGSLRASTPWRAAGVLPALERDVAVDVREIDDEQARVVDELVVLVGVAHVDRGLLGGRDLLRRRLRVLLRVERVQRDLEAHLVVQRVRVEVPALVGVRRVLVLLQVPEPADRRELVLLDARRS